MSEQYAEGARVEWKWGSGKGSGIVQSVFEHSVTRTIDGSEITRSGSKDDPAYYIETSNNSNVLKLHSELEKQ